MLLFKYYPDMPGFIQQQGCKIYIGFWLGRLHNPSWKGSCVNGYADGHGEIQSFEGKNRAIYSGTFTKGEMLVGKMTIYMNGSITPFLEYQGNFIDYVFHGDGIMKVFDYNKVGNIHSEFGKTTNKSNIRPINKPATKNYAENNAKDNSAYTLAFGAIAQGLGQGLQQSGDAKQALVGQLLNGIGATMEGTPTNPTAILNTPSTKNLNLTPNNLAGLSVQSLPLSSDCSIAEQQAADYAIQVSNVALASGAAVCIPAIAARKQAEIGLHLNTRCPQGGTEFDNEMRRMINDADATIRGGCSN
jgi:hypothetical protein